MNRIYAEQKHSPLSAAFIPAAVALFAAAMSLAGCAAKGTSGANASAGTTSPAVTAESSKTVYPLSITHGLGETIIAAKPQRIATVGWSNHDVALALGVMPVGLSEANYGVPAGTLTHPWTAAKITELAASGKAEPVIYRDASGLDFEALADSRPDVILAAYSGITADEYGTLSRIAPTVAYPAAAWETLWRDQTRMNAAGMGMQAEGEALVAATETFIAEAVARYPEIAGKSAAFFYFFPTDFSKFYVYLPVDPRSAFLQDLGLTLPDSVKKIAETEKGFAVLVSAERVEEFADVDIAVTYGDAKLLADLAADPVMGRLKAVKQGAAALLEDNSALAASTTPSVLSIPAMLDEYLVLLEGAAKKVK